MAKTVAERRVDSYSSTSKSSGCSCTGVPGPCRRTALRSVFGRCSDERFARLPGLGRLLAVAPARHARHAVRPERRRIAQLGEEVTQGLLTDLANALGRQVELAALAVDEALVLQSLQGLLQANDVARGVVAEVAAHGVDVDLGQALGGVGSAEELLETLQLPSCSATEVASAKDEPSSPRMRCARFQSMSGVAIAQVRHQAIQREVQLHVLHHPGEHRTQFTLLLGRERVEHRFGGGGAFGHHAHRRPRGSARPGRSRRTSP